VQKVAENSEITDAARKMLGVIYLAHPTTVQIMIHEDHTITLLTGGQATKLNTSDFNSLTADEILKKIGVKANDGRKYADV